MTKDRIALFTCLPPTHSGIAVYSKNLITFLSKKYEFDVFLGSKPLKPAPGVFHHSEFAHKHLLNPYRVILYQLGNNQYHDFEYPYLAYYPGIVVLHDPLLFQARSRYLIENVRYREYEEEMHYCHGYSGAQLAQLTVKGPIPPLVGFLFSMNRLVIESSIGVGVHARYFYDQIKFEYSHSRIFYIPMAFDISDIRMPEWNVKNKLGISDDTMLLGSAGFIEQHKGAWAVLQAIKEARTKRKIKFIWIGKDSYNRLREMIKREGLENDCFITGYVSEGDMLAYMKALDIFINLRYPTAGEFSAVLLMAFQLGKASIMTDLPHLYEIPKDIVMKVDVANEVESLVQAINFLIENEAKRIELGTNAEEYVRKNHNPAAMLDAYDTMIEEAKKVDIKNITGNKLIPRHWQSIAINELLPDSPEEVREDWQEIIEQIFWR